MPQDDGQEPQDTQIAEPVEVQPEATPEATAPEQANPFWGEVEQLTGPNVFKTIQPHLAKADTAAREQITKLNQKYEPWSKFEAEGVTPDLAQQAIAVVKQLNDPQGQVQVYESLRNFLSENGRLPDQAELAQQVQEDIEDGPEADPRDQELAELRERFEQFSGFFEQQQQAQEQQRIAEEADAWADNEWKRIIETHKDLGKEDLPEIAQILQAQTNRGEAPDIDKAVAHFTALRDRIRTTPRPNDTAPRVPNGPGGGSPSGARVDPGSLSKQERIALVASRVGGGRS